MREAAPDIELWRRAASGDRDAFEEVFRLHGARVYNFCFRRTADWAQAEDATSTVFMEAWRRRGEVIVTGGSVLPWLLGIANNVTRNLHRSEVRRDRAIDRLPLPPDGHGDFADDVAQRTDDERRMREVLDLLATLPARDQEIVHLCVWSGLTNEQAAEALGEPVGTVKSRLSRAKQRLRRSAGTMVTDTGPSRPAGPGLSEGSG